MTRNLTYTFFTIFTLSYLYLNIRGITHYSDDVWFSNAAHTPDIFKWLTIRYQTWSSRTTIEFALLNVINHKQIWAIFNSIFISATISSISYIVSNNIKETIYSTLIFMLIIIITIKKGFIKDGILWMTGSVNYLWPFALSITGFALLKSIAFGDGSYKLRIFIPLIFFLSSFSEQMVVINIFLLTLITFIYRGARQRIAIISLLVSTVALLYILLSPGNTMRLHLEVSRWNPDFVNLNILQKVSIGLNLSYDQIFSVQPITFIIIYLCLFVNFTKNVKAKSLSLLLLLLTVSLTLIQKNLFTTMEFDTIYRFSSKNATGYFAIARATIVVFISISTTLLLTLYQKESKAAWTIAATYVVSYSGTVMLCLSPTVYASGQRVLMVSGLMFSALATYLAIRTIKCTKFQKKIYIKEEQANLRGTFACIIDSWAHQAMLLH